MDFKNLAQEMGTQMVHRVINDIYQEIVWQHILYAIKVGLVAGLIMAVVGTILGLLKFTKLDITNYTGCMLTYKRLGAPSFIAGFLFHMVMSAVFGVVYLYLIHTFSIPASYMIAILIGVVHSIISGSMLLILDRINPCVTSKMLKPMGFAASAQGSTAMCTYFLIHIIFAVIMVMKLAQ